jgi:hypothetical protein
VRLPVQGLLARGVSMRLMPVERPHKPDTPGVGEVRGVVQDRVLPDREHLRQMQPLVLDLRHFPLAVYVLSAGD